VTSATVEGLTPDGRTLVLRLGDEHGGQLVEVPMAEVRRAQRHAPPLPLGGGPTPREVQHRIRHGESAEEIALGSGLPVGDVARYEGPVLAERAHQAIAARRTEVDGSTVEQVVTDHLERVAAGEPVVWDCWQTDPYRWEVLAAAGEHRVRMAWDPRARRVDPVDEPARQAFGLAPPPPDALEEVLRPVRSRPAPPAEPAGGPEPEDSAAAPDAPAPDRPAPRRRGRAQVPLWEDIGAEVAGGRRAEQPGR
jgi:hypothetical protein